MEGDSGLAHSVSTRLTDSYTAAAGRKFGATVGAAFLALAFVARWRAHPTSFVVFAILGLALLGAGLAIPTALGPIERAWMAMAKAISKVTTPVFMAVVYFVVLSPIAMLRRAFGGNALVHHTGSLGFWKDRRELPRSSMDRQF
jgi:Saxitoxin biosynthesis operon protein SxtJ